MAETTNIEWKVGDYVVHRGSIARIQSLKNPTTLELVAYYDKGVGVTCGGGCMMGGDRTADLKPVTDARDILIVRAYGAQLAVKEAKKAASEQQHAFEVYTAALKALDEAKGFDVNG